MNRRALAACLSLIACLAATAPAYAQSVAAQAGAEALARRCAAAGGRPREASGLVRAIELAGRPATALDAQRFSCQGAAAVDCGPFGCKLSIYLDGAAPVFETYVKAWRARGGKLEIMRVGAYCAAAGESCSETYQASGGALTLAARGEAKFERDAAPRAVAISHSPQPASRADGRSAAPPRRTAARAAREADVRAQMRRDRAGRASTRGRFDANETAVSSAPAAAPAPPVAPGVTAARRRRLDAAPYVP